MGRSQTRTVRVERTLHRTPPPRRGSPPPIRGGASVGDGTPAGALEVANRTLHQIVVPRSPVVGLPADLPVDETVPRLVAAGHSRAPVYTDGVDDTDRTVSVGVLVGRDGTVGDHARPGLALPESLNALVALREMRTQRQQLAVVVSEHGGVEGIITLKNLIEELVGEIYDELHRDIRAVEHQPGGSMQLPGTFPIHDLADLAIDIPEQTEVTTIGALLVARDTTGSRSQATRWRSTGPNPSAFTPSVG